MSILSTFNNVSHFLQITQTIALFFPPFDACPLYWLIWPVFYRHFPSKTSFYGTLCTIAHVLPKSRVSLFNPLPFLLSEQVGKCQRGPKDVVPSMVAEKVRQSTTEEGYVHILAERRKEAASDQAHISSSLSVVNDGDAPETTVTPEFLYPFSEILTVLFGVGLGLQMNSCGYSFI